MAYLVLILRRGEVLHIGEEVTLELVETRRPGGCHARARLGLTAPRRIPIDREEVHRGKLAALAEKGGNP